MLDLMKGEKDVRFAIAAESVYRMVGPNGLADATDKQRLDFAEGVLKTNYDSQLIDFLGNVHHARTVKMLFGFAE